MQLPVSLGPIVAPRRRLRVALVNTPWARTDVPSIQCGLMQAVTRAAGHDCDVRYLNLELGRELYAALVAVEGGATGKALIDLT